MDVVYTLLVLYSIKYYSIQYYADMMYILNGVFIQLVPQTNLSYTFIIIGAVELGVTADSWVGF